MSFEPDVQTDHNHTYFSEIRTDVGAYLLGLYAADGCVRHVSTRGREIRLKLRTKDCELVTLARDELAPSATVHHWGDDAVLQFHSTRMADDLATWGVVPRKTYENVWPHRLHPRWHRSYLLGYFDGNGYAGIIPRGNGTRAQWILSSRPDFLELAADAIESGSGVRPAGPYQYGTLGAQLKAVCNKARTIDEWLHSGPIRGLDRKCLGHLTA